jgi:hypothetical protein
MVDRLLLKTMAGSSPKAQITGGKAASVWQRVGDNAFHLGLGNALRKRVPSCSTVVYQFKSSSL